MVKFYQHVFNYDSSWQNVTLAFWLRYPNPFASHVLAVDVLDRCVDENGVLKTTRLVLKKGKAPKWFPESFLKSSEAFIIEESEVDPKNKTMVTRTKNLNHVRVMQIVETQYFKQHEQNPEWTSCKTEARIISRFGWGMTQRIEGFGQSSFIANAAKARKGMQHILQMIRDKQTNRTTASAP
ncbi:PRELI-like family-domain-containing protein [Mycotypha africana]|uniref:PRELI-like family-domain-containing protein n=1 Tax=Mycotypha africana TaxID=64632 RepID=UPI0023010259|nr:PRELI-like family-domain-containing protein [Mycotypha africana]KAI8971457.1 PRELI-like family-domain-containing protein [Mycotypha africana]